MCADKLSLSLYIPQRNSFAVEPTTFEQHAVVNPLLRLRHAGDVARAQPVQRSLAQGRVPIQREVARPGSSGCRDTGSDMERTWLLGVLRPALVGDLDLFGCLP